MSKTKPIQEDSCIRMSRLKPKKNQIGRRTAAVHRPSNPSRPEKKPETRDGNVPVVHRLRKLKTTLHQSHRSFNYYRFNLMDKIKQKHHNSSLLLKL